MPLLQALKMPRIYVLGALAVFAIFVAYPELDLVISGWFYDVASQRFPLRGAPWLDAISFAFNTIAGLFVTACLAVTAILAVKDRQSLMHRWKIPAYLALVFVIGPVLLVTLGFKEHWGRARPVDVDAFGGDKQFTAFYLPSDQCESDCSFVSGHTSRGFYFMALYFLVAAAGVSVAKQRGMLLFALSYGSTAAICRVIEGKHYATDVIGSALLVTYVAWVLFRLMQPMAPAALPKN